MNRRNLVLMAGVLLLLLTSCASTPETMKVSEIKRVGIVNLFQDLPTYSKFEFTKFLVGEAELPGMRNYLTQKFIMSLEAAGIQAQGVSNHLPLLRGEVDLILELQPRKRVQQDIPEMGYRAADPVLDDGSNGFGFYYKSLLFTKEGPESYVSMVVVGVENKGGTLVPTSEQKITKRVDMNLPEMPNSWGQLSDREKQEMEFSLRRTIEDSVKLSLSKLGF